MLTSLPSGIPLPRVAVNPITFATSVLNVKYSLSATPRNIVFISGIPEPNENEWKIDIKKCFKHKAQFFFKLQLNGLI